MKKPLIIVGLCILGLFFASFDFQNSNAGVIQYLKKIEGYIGFPLSNLETELGVPDDKTSDSSVFVYHVKNKEGDITGYRLFGIKEQEISCYSEKNIVAEEQAMSLYQRVADFMGESEHAASIVSAKSTPDIFSDNHRVTRHRDHTWEVDMLLRNSRSNILFIVYAHENRSCYQELVKEVEQIDKKLRM